MNLEPFDIFHPDAFHSPPSSGADDAAEVGTPPKQGYSHHTRDQFFPPLSLGHNVGMQNDVYYNQSGLVHPSPSQEPIKHGHTHTPYWTAPELVADMEPLHISQTPMTSATVVTPVTTRPTVDSPGIRNANHDGCSKIPFGGAKESFPSNQSPTSCPGKKLYHIENVLDNDVICGRRCYTSKHVGNCKFREAVENMKEEYQRTDSKKIKIHIGRSIVEHVCSYGGRFVSRDDKTGQFYILTKGEAFKKTTRALRERGRKNWKQSQTSVC